MQGPCRKGEGNSCKLLCLPLPNHSDPPRNGMESPSRRYLQNHGSEQLKKTPVCVFVLKIALKVISDSSNHFGISVLVILAVIYFLHSHQYY